MRNILTALVASMALVGISAPAASAESLAGRSEAAQSYAMITCQHYAGCPWWAIERVSVRHYSDSSDYVFRFVTTYCGTKMLSLQVFPLPTQYQIRYPTTWGGRC